MLAMPDVDVVDVDVDLDVGGMRKDSGGCAVSCFHPSHINITNIQLPQPNTDTIDHHGVRYRVHALDIAGHIVASS
jgi:hypothetical protein